MRLLDMVAGGASVLRGGVAIMGTIVVTVHGTNDGADSDSGDKWWQTDSNFCSKLRAKGGSRGVDLDIRPFHWDGANSDVARREAGRRLARLLHRLLRQAGEANVVGHSHGGNVIVYALEDPWLERAYRRGALRVVSVGTPFFAGRRRWISTINEVAVRTILCAVAIGVAGLGLWLAGITDGVWPQGHLLRVGIAHLGLVGDRVGNGAGASLQGVISGAQYAEPIVGWMFRAPTQLIAIAVVAICVVLGPLLLRMLLTLSARAIDLVTSPTERPTWRSVAHPADEAIALLVAIPRTRLDPMTRRGAARSVRRLVPLIAIVIAVLAIATIWFKAPAYVLTLPDQIARHSEVSMMELAWREVASDLELNAPLPHRWSSNSHSFIVAEEDLANAAGNDPHRLATLQEMVAEVNGYREQVTELIEQTRYDARQLLGELMIVVLSVLTILALLAVWVVQLLIVALSPVIGQGISFVANRSVTGAMTGAALGEDGEFVLRKVSGSAPSRFAAREVALSQAAAEQMYVDADRNAGESLRRIRRSIDTTPERTTGDAFGDLLSHISWRELIHTSYFECEQVVEIVLDGVVPESSAAPMPEAA